MADSTTARIEDLLAHADWVRRLAHSLVRDPATADDVVQETFLAALERPPQVKSARAWLAGVVRNRAKMRYRSESRRTRRETTVAESRSSLPSTDEVVGKMETQRLLAEAVLALDEPYRSTVLLRHLEGLSSAEIAAEQGVPAATVRGRLKRGLELLRIELDQRHGGDRNLWLRALSPFLAPGAIGRAGPGLLSTLLQGVLLMKTTTKIAAAALLLTFTVVGAFALDILPFGSADTGTEPSPIVAEVDDASPDTDSPELVGRERPDTMSDTDTSPDRPEVRAPKAGPTPPSSLAVRFIDSAGRAVEGVTLLCSNPANTPKSASDGDGHLAWLIDGGRGGSFTWHVIAHGYATRTLRANVEPDARLDLGDIELAPGGAAEGVVLDPEGRPLAGARVVATEPGMGSDERRTLVKGPLMPELALDTTTDERGAFRLNGLPVGFARVWAGAEGMRYGSSPAIEISAATTQGGLELRLTRGQPEDTVEGRVVGPDGKPAANVQLSYRYRYDRGSSSSTLHLDDDGRFRITTWAPGDLDFSAWNDKGLRAAPLEGVKPGTHDVVLELRALRTTTLVVVDQAGTPIPTFVARVLAKEGYPSFETVSVADQAEGRAELQVPPEPFHVEVFADGYTRVRAPLIQPDAVPHPIEVRLERLAGVTGSVRSATGPVAGAAVSLYRVAAENEAIEVDGFRAQVKPQPVAEATTDEHGRFRLDLRQEGRFVLRVQADGFAAAEQADLSLTPTVPAGPFDLVLDGGGSIRGTVRVAGARSAAGLIVGATRGDAHPVSVRTASDGTFLLDKLTPGPWQVRLIKEELLPGSRSTSISRGARPRPIKWTCEVAAGETTDVELTLGGAQPVALRGSLTFDGAGAKGWRAHIMPMPTAGTMIGKPLGTAAVEDNGAFTLGVDEPGEYVIRLEPADGSLATVFLTPLHLTAGDNHWSLDATTGTVAGTKGEEALPQGELYLYVWKGAEGLIGIAPVMPGPDGRFELFVLAGAGRIVHMDRDAMMQMATVAIPDPWSWPLVAEIDVPEGETVEVELP